MLPEWYMERNRAVEAPQTPCGAFEALRLLHEFLASAITF